MLKDLNNLTRMGNFEHIVIYRCKNKLCVMYDGSKAKYDFCRLVNNEKTNIMVQKVHYSFQIAN